MYKLMCSDYLAATILIGGSSSEGNGTVTSKTSEISYNSIKAILRRQTWFWWYLIATIASHTAYQNIRHEKEFQQFSVTSRQSPPSFILWVVAGLSSVLDCPRWSSCLLRLAMQSLGRHLTT